MPLPTDYFKLKNGNAISIDPAPGGQVFILLTTPGNRHEAFAWDPGTNKFQGNAIPQDIFDAVDEYKRRNDLD